MAVLLEGANKMEVRGLKAITVKKADLLERVRDSVTRLLADADVRVDQVDTVFFTGGSSGIPALRNSVSAMLPNARHVEGNIFGSIGSGLAIEAAKRYG